MILIARLNDIKMALEIVKKFSLVLGRKWWKIAAPLPPAEKVWIFLVIGGFYFITRVGGVGKFSKNNT